MKRHYAVILFGLATVVALMGGCDTSMPEQYDSLKTRQTVIDTFETTDVYLIEDRYSDRWVVRSKDGSIWLVATSRNNVIYSKSLLFPAPRSAPLTP